MNTLGRLSETVRESLDGLAEGWYDLWNTTRHAITRFTPALDSEANESGAQNRWAVLSADLHESADDLSVSLEAPGLKSDDFEILIDGQMLIVRGSKLSEIKRSKGRYHMSERAFGQFERRFALPMDVEESETTASYRSGVLTINLTKSRSAKPRVISVSD